ncbi:hypothetical protein GGS24DRAFT_154101 [Hypoxylon argillaceum]|nr:hypothetical protein GGS24DRAFT_154101 [Hypoxylon argillaceum]
MHAFKHSPLHLFLGMLCCALLCYAVCCTVGRYVVNWPPLIRHPPSLTFIPRPNIRDGMSRLRVLCGISWGMDRIGG